MLNESFLNGEAEFFKQEHTFDGVEDVCEYTSIGVFPVQICCTEGELFVNDCGVKYTTGKDVTIKVNPDFPVEAGSNRHKYTFKLTDCIGYMGEFRVEDITCVVFPVYGLHCYKIIGYKITENG